MTFDDRYRLEVGSQVLELSYHGVAHAPGNIFIHAPKQRTLMVVDVIFPGWMPWRRFALAQDVPGYFAQVDTISRWSFDTLVGGHVGRTGTPADVATQRAFMQDLKAAAQAALKTTVPARRARRGRPRQSVGRVRSLHRSRRGELRQPADAEVVAAARRLRRLHLGPVLCDGTEPAHRLMPDEEQPRRPASTPGGSDCPIGV